MPRYLPIALALLFSCFPKLAHAEQDLLYYILDGSGSMWGRVEGKIKIEIAKDVLGNLISEMPEEVHTGLMVYGHRRKGDCTDIQEIIKAAKVDKTAAKKMINKISPKGKTPISDSIQKAIELIKGNEYESTIVLVSDGIETCEKDPCQLVEKLKATGVEFVMHVVGFAVDNKAAKQLQCIAESGGGQYFLAENSSDLLAALTKVKTSVVEKKVIPTPLAPTATPQPTATPIVQKLSEKSTSIKIKVKGPGRVKLVHDSWAQAPYYWTLIDPESGEEKARFNNLDEQLVQAGLYQLVWRQSEHGSTDIVLGEIVDVKSGETTEVSLKTGIKLILPTWVKAPRAWKLRDPLSAKDIVSFRALEAQLVPSGNFDLIWHQYEHASQALIIKNINLKPDLLNEVEVKTALHPVPAAWLPAKPRFWELTEIESGKSIARFSNNFEPQLVPTGKYNFIYRQSEHDSSNSSLGLVEVKEGEITEFAINTGVKILPKEGTPNPYFIEFVSLDPSGKELERVRVSHSFNPMALRAGKYKINYRQSEHGSSTITLVESFDLPAGNLVEIEM